MFFSSSFKFIHKNYEKKINLHEKSLITNYDRLSDASQSAT